MKRNKDNSNRYMSNNNKNYKHAEMTVKTKMTVKTSSMMKSKTKRDRHQMRYIKCPFYHPLVRLLSDEMRNNGLSNITLAPSTVRTNRKLIFTSTKCRKLRSDCIYIYINASFNLMWKNCDFGVKLRTSYLNVEKTILHFKNREGSMVNEHLKSHPDHVFHGPKNVHCFNSRRELNLSCDYECEEMNVRKHRCRNNRVRFFSRIC